MPALEKICAGRWALMQELAYVDELTDTALIHFSMEFCQGTLGGSLP